MKFKKGFTLIEVIVVVGSVVIVLPALFGIVFSLLRQQIKIYRLSEVKRQGDYALAIMENNIRQSAFKIYNQPTGGTEICANAGDTDIPASYFRDETDKWFRYTLNGTKIASQSQIPNATADLTSATVSITNLTITCSRTARFSTPIISVQFTVTSGAAGQPAQERAQMTYRTRIKVRNY